MTTTEKQPSAVSRPYLLAVVEIVVILLLLYCFAGSPPPGDDEVHYLGKAKQYWNPDWLAGDFFLETPDAHVVFNWTIGWLTLFFSLETVAWLGRLAAWASLAFAWRRLSWALVPLPFASLLTMALFLIFQQHGTAAREWIVGGVEAKCFAYVFVILGLEQLVHGRWNWVWPLLGLAAAFHVLVGGWAVAAALLAWVATKDRPSFVSMLPWLFAGGLLALPGVIPGVMLTWQADPEVVNQANQIYVFERLSHHLLVYDFPLRYKLQFLTALAAWLVVCFLIRSEKRGMPLRRFVLGSVVIGIVGIVVDQATMEWPDVAASLLRYYWYRLPDMMVQVGLAMALVEAYVVWRRRQPQAAQAYLAVVSIAAMSVMGWHFAQQRSDDRPTADIQGHIGDSDPQEYEDWRILCAWIRGHTPPDATFLTPSNATSFRWYANRAEVVGWKDIPQNAAGIVQWRDRLQQTRAWWQKLQQSRQVTPELMEELCAMAAPGALDFQYVIVPRSYGAAKLGPLMEANLEIATADEHPWFAVYAVPPAASGED